MQFQGVYEAHIKTILNKSLVDNKPTINKVNKINMDVIVQGVVVTIIDDIFNTNLPMFHLTVLPINMNQVENKDYTGFKDLNVTIEASYFNYNAQEWEPLLENFTVIVEAFVDGADERVKRMNISFADRNPTINISTELLVLGMSLVNKLNSKPNEVQARLFKQAIQKVAMRAMTTRGAAGTYESLAVLDKDKMMNFINEFGG